MSAAGLCDWCELPIVGEAWDWHGTVGHPRCIVSVATRIWASRPIPDETPPPIDTRALEAIRAAGICGWCLEPLGDQRSDFGGAVGHRECARYAYESVAGDPAMPWPIPEPSDYETPAFFERLGRAAAKHGVDADRLRRAIEEAVNV